ncbi:hypothetical protein BDU57DRAFT_198321 [Ampelomyces quisqualis]|uniref:Uncharacterized protein n=1 Tax=Ampelomyces quisqualis TaxID=50730 RepID=A0A6A5QUE4_AMPQU|nr:hypothetical protein BDU57DRAFT_198321 [Ampelomyces quisqualis]
MATFWNRRTAIIAGVAITLLGAYYVYQSPTSIAYTMSNTTSSNRVPGLEFKLTQSSRNPPVLLATLKNNADTPYTLLKWGTPFDSAALNTGIFKITNAETGVQVEQMVLQINRKMPPPQDELVTIAPGTEEEMQVVFNKPWMPAQKPAKYKVKAEGDLKGLWDKYGGDLTEDDLNAYIESPFSGRKFSTNEVVMEVH